MAPHLDQFSGQAEIFDERAGWEPAVGAQIARAIVTALSLASDDLVLEVGAGTGTIGQHLGALPIRYLGMDVSRPMLAVFRRKLGGASARVSIVQADGNRPWPVRGRSTAAVVASRVVHRLDVAHVVEELVRLLRPGGHLLIGRVTRDRHSLKSRLRRQKRALLVERGIAEPGEAAKTRQLIERCLARGATTIDSMTVCQWTGRTTPARILSAWEGHTSMGGLEVAPDVQQATLRDLRAWAERECGDLDRPETFTDAYAIEGVRMP